MSADDYIHLYDEIAQEYEIVAGSPDAELQDLQSLHERITFLLHAHGIEDGGDLVDYERREVRALEEEVLQLEEEQQRLQGGSPVSVSAKRGTVEVHRPVEAQVFATQVAELHAELFLAQMVFNALLRKSLEDIREERVCMTDLRYAETWRAMEAQILRSLADTKEKAGQQSPPVSVAAEEKLLTEVRSLAAEAIKHVGEGNQDRQKRDDQLKCFYSECEKLTVWCRQQLANLDAMLEPDHVQEYCSTLVDNYATMSSNFSVLVDSVEEYVKANHLPVRRALVEVNQLWYYVLTSTLERLTRTLLEIHPTSSLEEEVAKYAQHPKCVVDIVRSLKTLLESGGPSLSAAAESLLSECDALLPAATALESSLVREHMLFSERRRAVKEGYAGFRESLLARLTYISSPADVVMNSKRRQEEFDECVRDLKTWASAAAHGESWRDLYSQIVDIKRLIQHELKALSE